VTKNQFKKAFAKSLKQARTDRGLTQAELAGHCGLTQDWICHFECGSRLPSAYVLHCMSNIVGIEFFGDLRK